MTLLQFFEFFLIATIGLNYKLEPTLSLFGLIE
ncbi:hypothetical protein SAMN05428964_1011037 [Thalassospira xiamenensis]|uniref:Uncharacterized protein n=1 Tax=Thalassospira xiamenensis TaxID=220697 RepID=A0A285RQ26_9PROT|nr:hypothetical protein SAMN05428964_1011037 [Thalassospira xiamenensis]